MVGPADPSELMSVQGTGISPNGQRCEAFSSAIHGVLRQMVTRRVSEGRTGRHVESRFIPRLRVGLPSRAARKCFTALPNGAALLEPRAEQHKQSECCAALGHMQRRHRSRSPLSIRSLVSRDRNGTVARFGLGVVRPVKRFWLGRLSARPYTQGSATIRCRSRRFTLGCNRATPIGVTWDSLVKATPSETPLTIYD